MNTFEFFVIKKSKYEWPILKGKPGDYALVRFLEENSRGGYVFSEKVIALDDWNAAAKLHNKRKGRKWWK